MKTILHTVHVHTAPDRVWEALTTAGGLSGWWTRRVEVEEGPDGLIRFEFHGDFHPRMRQARLDREAGEIEWRCEGGHANWQGDRFVFSLEERDGETALFFRQEYSRELSDEVYGTYNFNWGYYLSSLRKWCESGEGTPFEPPG